MNGLKAPKVAQDKVPSSPRLVEIASTLLFLSGYALEYSEVLIEECCNGLRLTEFKLLLFMCMYVCVCMSVSIAYVCTYMCISGAAHMCSCMWRPEADVRCHALPLSPYILRQDPSAAQGAHYWLV